MAYDENYKDGVALSTGWVAGGEGGAKSIITSQLAGARARCGCGRPDRSSTGSRACTWKVRTTTRRTSSTPRSLRSHRSPGLPQAPTVATTSTVYGADLLVAGTTPGGQEVRKYTLERPAPDATTLAPKLIDHLAEMPHGPDAARPAARAGAR